MIINKMIKGLFSSYLYRAKEKLDNLPQISVEPNDYQILEEPKKFQERVLYHIKNAKKRICLCALYLQNDEMGKEVLNELYAAKQKNNNLDIRIYVDFHRAQRGLHGKGPQVGNNVWYQEMAKNQSIHPIIYGVPVKKREIFGVLHMKGFVFDDTVIYSGASINNVYMHRMDNYRIDRYHEIYSPSLANTICNYCSDVFHKNEAVQDLSKSHIPSAKELRKEIKEFRNTLVNSSYLFTSENIEQNKIGITPLVGLGKKNNQLNDSIINLIYSANNNIFLCTPYFNIPKRVEKAINIALKNGIKISIVIGDKKANDFFIRDNEKFNKIGAIPYIYEQNLVRFIKSHQEYINSNLLTIHLWENNNNSYHIKGIFVDNNYFLITGNNINPRAWGLDLENGLLIHDHNHLLQEKTQHEIKYILQNTRKITSENDIESFSDYPEEVKKLLLRVKKLGAQWFLRKLL